jgi:NhaA family Na+:H+ antiporter
MWLANGIFAADYQAVLATIFTSGFGGAAISMPVSELLKSGLMAVFFLYAGLELKRELLEGALASRASATLPLAAAVGGMAMPAVIYLVLAGPEYAHGWAIPAATDIAFALGVLALLGNRVPGALKAFVLAVAVIDDMGAILIIAFFYSGALQPVWLLASAGITAILFAFNQWGTGRLGIYCLLGVPLWLAVNASGINPTLAGVIVALAVPMRDRSGGSPLLSAEHALRPYVLFGIMPVFALGAAGAALPDDAVGALLHPVALAIALGLAVGKPVGITAGALIAARLLRTQLPARPVHILGLGSIAGIGFTMSLFIGKLAFLDEAMQAPVKLGVYAGSLIAAACGLALLARTLAPRSDAQAEADVEGDRPFIAQTRDAPQGNTEF